ncbi:hypothetical protein GCM10009801_73170 [Streptomyces albiaxialis]|uniref:Uncharacterized protein n=1 Tax=Streptomyces albiaxialis TaxID=329523 RepID=A0ABN2WX88_9ACTN
MSEATAAGRPNVPPQPPRTLKALREALELLCPTALPQFDREAADAMSRARTQLAATPMHQMLDQWAHRVAAERLGTARRMDELVQQMEAAESMEAVRPLLAELRQLQDEAEAEAGRA